MPRSDYERPTRTAARRTALAELAGEVLVDSRSSAWPGGVPVAEGSALHAPLGRSLPQDRVSTPGVRIGVAPTGPSFRRTQPRLTRSDPRRFNRWSNANVSASQTRPLPGGPRARTPRGAGRDRGRRRARHRTARAALRSLRESRPRTLVFAAPVCAPQAIPALREEADSVLCVSEPPFFQAVGQWYSDFSQVDDDEVVALLDRYAGGTDRYSGGGR